VGPQLLQVLFSALGENPFNEQALENDFEWFTEYLLTVERDYFLYRDFQSRNIMVRDGEPFFIDYQGGRRGALQYDVASLLFDAKADLPFEIRGELLERYLKAASALAPIDRQAFLRHYPGFAHIRIMQAMARTACAASTSGNSTSWPASRMRSATSSICCVRPSFLLISRADPGVASAGGVLLSSAVRHGLAETHGPAAKLRVQGRRADDEKGTAAATCSTAERSRTQAGSSGTRS